mmetsp:Transcript_36617/g.101675  ORF Transcript_36617/g.101675 Transcript_36617/m.101675 type:complete len:294 (-) Transcript_36617:184-1065(-)|eukprot:CAMPEP_0179121142 /NCGR_PEP_ID=MMETSP0796-20121207/57112_1 /TAXON_ID=73915 /ORGANISM="Pyrodinium bahamense, Strain pbaha01" /LENGTH=293 /DNA_ID=CAMNT_0020819713 /DNA_START=88 /DNA_END=969 /DNA_ORIENTATION=+
MASFVQLAALVSIAAFVTAESAAKDCTEGECDADETRLLQQGTRPAAKKAVAQGLADARDELEAKPTHTDWKWWWGNDDDTVLSFKPGDIDKALEMGTAANIGPNFDTGVLDLTGIWYLLWDPNESLGIRLYRKQRLEIAISFAGSKISKYSDPNSPFHLKMPGQMPRHWAYSDAYGSTLQMFVHAIQWPYCLPLSFEFENHRKAYIAGIGPFIYLNEDQWQRPTETPVGTQTYRMSRIVYANGTRTKYWADYKNLMKGYKIQVWNTIDQKQRCESTAPISLLCHVSVDTASC